MEGQCAVPHVVQDTNTQTGTTALRRTPKTDPQPHTPSRVTFEAQNTVTNAAEPTIIDHGSHNVDAPVQRHLQKTGQPRGAELRLRCRGEVTSRRSGGREEHGCAGRNKDRWKWGNRARDNRRGRRGPRQKDAAEMQKGKGALEGNGRQQRTDLEGRHDWGLKDKIVGERHEVEGNTKEGERLNHNRGWQPRGLRLT